MAIRYKELTDSNKDLIYMLYQSGNYYMNEICRLCHISQKTLYRVIEEMVDRGYNDRHIR